MSVIGEGMIDACRMLLTLDERVWGAALRTLWIASLAVLAATVVGVLLGVGLARSRFWGRELIVLAFRVGMSCPTVLIGVLGFTLLMRQGPLGELHLLYTSWGVMLGEFFLALPIIVTLVHGAVRSLDPRVWETAQTLGAPGWLRLLTYLQETRLSLVLAILTAFARCSTELGIALLVGGNLRHTQTLATLAREEIRQGEFSRGIATSLVLLGISVVTTVLIAWLGRAEDER
ncbi:MAG TPA: hypothetical protein DCY79_08925 [Planctomycetaceae bacterium]|nr:hypothetical protein [Blastopirellula sp.]HAY79913.1 hypothetical protein [Planctomycetaceae bacterium]